MTRYSTQRVSLRPRPAVTYEYKSTGARFRTLNGRSPAGLFSPTLPSQQKHPAALKLNRIRYSHDAQLDEMSEASISTPRLGSARMRGRAWHPCVGPAPTVKGAAAV